MGEALIRATKKRSMDGWMDEWMDGWMGEVLLIGKIVGWSAMFPKCLSPGDLR